MKAARAVSTVNQTLMTSPMPSSRLLSPHVVVTPSAKRPFRISSLRHEPKRLCCLNLLIQTAAIGQDLNIPAERRQPDQPGPAEADAAMQQLRRRANLDTTLSRTFPLWTKNTPSLESP
jgi:hypothetical protein